MIKTKLVRLTVLLFIVALLSTAVLMKPASAVSSPAFSNWYWTGDTVAKSVVTADANNDNQIDVVIGGYYNGGTGWNSQLHVLNGTSYAVENVGFWNWGPNSQINSVAVGDVNGDGKNEIVTGGSYFNGTVWWSLVSVQNCSSTSTALTTLNIGAWLRGNSSQVSSVSVGDLYGDGKKEIIAGGSYYNGSLWSSTVDVMNVSTTSTALIMNSSATWLWGIGSQVNSITVGDVNGDNRTEIVVGGQYNDGVRDNALLQVLNCTTNSSSLNLLNYGSWFWTGNTQINSVTTANITGSAALSIITGGSFFDGSRQNSLVHILNVNLTAPFFVVNQTAYWVWTGNTTINSIVAGNFTGGTTLDIVTAGTYYDGQRYVAQLMDLNCANMAQRIVTTWFTTSDTVLNSIAVANTTLGIRINAAGFYFDGTRSVAQLTVWA
jgi:hypothetical protein